MKILVCANIIEDLQEMEEIIGEQKCRIEKHYYLSRSICGKSTKNVYAHSFNSQTSVIKKAIDFLNFLVIILKVRPAVIFTGSSMLKYRLVSQAFRIKHIAYFRALHFDSENLSGFSDRLKYGLLKGRFKYFLNAYEASEVIVTSPLTYDFIKYRGVDDKKIVKTYPRWLESLSQNKNESKRANVVFLTQAFKAHGHDKAHLSQSNVLNQIFSEIDTDKEYKLVIRPHPRDEVEYERAFPGVNIDKTSSKEFLSTLSRLDIVISPLSTLAFEISHVAGGCVFYTTPELNVLYGKAYSALEITPYGVGDIVDMLKNKRSLNKKGKNVFYSKSDSDKIRI